MKTNNNHRTENLKSDIDYHLQSLKIGINTLQLNCNRDKYIYLFCEKASQKLVIIDKLINNSNLAMPIKIATEVNRLFSIDENLSTVHIKILNKKRCINPTGIAILNLEL
jgi:hypothetical protein